MVGEGMVPMSVKQLNRFAGSGKPWTWPRLIGADREERLNGTTRFTDASVALRLPRTSYASGERDEVIRTFQRWDKADFSTLG